MILLFGIFIAFLGAPVELVKPAAAFLPQGFNSISGHVSDNSRNPIPDLQIELLNDVDSVVRRTKTNGSGLFQFNRLPPGIFQVRVQTYGTIYVGGQSRRVQLERTRAFEQVDFVLTTKRATANSSTPGVVFVQEVPDQARKEYERGIVLLQKSEQQKEGVQSLKKAIELFPTYFEALEMLGTEYVKQLDFDAAIPVLTKAIEINGRAHHSLSSLSVAQYNLKQLPAAVESMKRAITHNQKSASANLWLGMLLRQADKLDEAETYLKQADKLAESKLPDVHWQLALLFNQVKKYKEAADELELFLKLQPDARDTENIKKLIKRFRQLSSEKS
ncbi:MAG TPA: tetratricopeptide repeat protein [Pyrinomonadaceae bacterium]|nr:tetratricopeptide repeat protein [Pyrinomonadaceae bacterium]